MKKKFNNLYIFHIIGNHAPNFCSLKCERMDSRMSQIWTWLSKVSLRPKVIFDRSCFKNITHCSNRKFFILKNSVSSDCIFLWWILNDYLVLTTLQMIRRDFCRQYAGLFHMICCGDLPLYYGTFISTCIIQIVSWQIVMFSFFSNLV